MLRGCCGCYPLQKAKVTSQHQHTHVMAHRWGQSTYMPKVSSLRAVITVGRFPAGLWITGLVERSQSGLQKNKQSKGRMITKLPKSLKESWTPRLTKCTKVLFCIYSLSKEKQWSSSFIHTQYCTISNSGSQSSWLQGRPFSTTILPLFIFSK